MGIDSFYRSPANRAAFDEHIGLPVQMSSWSGRKVAVPIAPAQHAPVNAALIGATLDYLLRFYAEAMNPAVFHERRWVARLGLETARDLDADSALLRQLEALVVAGERARDSVKRTEEFSTEVLHGAFGLAQLDAIARRNKVFPLRGPTNVELADLRSLVGLFRHQAWLVATKRLDANPVFRGASGLVGGADADLIVDGILVDIKTVLRLKNKREVFRQLVTYLALATIAAGSETAGIEHLGVYLARHGELVGFEAADVTEQPGWGKFVDWLRCPAAERRAAVVFVVGDHADAPRGTGSRTA